MIIKKYQGTNEEDATKKAKAELGADAVIMNVKKVNYKGLKKIFKKAYVEVTAAVDEPSDRVKTGSDKDSLTKGFYKSGDASSTSQAIEERLDNLTHIIEKQMNVNAGNNDASDTMVDNLGFSRSEQQNSQNNYARTSTASAAYASAAYGQAANMKKMAGANSGNESGNEAANSQTSENSKMVQLVFDQLVNNEVTAANAREIMSEIDANGHHQLDDLLGSVYQKIVLKLGQMKTIEVEDNKPKVVFFIGPTGVGKTTTIAKLASKYKLEKKCKLAIITADTYRIAAVEQIRTYANILSVPIDVVYTSEELKSGIEKYKDYDLIFVDTAGRSHNNTEQKEDVKKMLDSMRGYHQEIYLVVSATTKYRDLVKITQTYSDITNYRLLFTKIDETSALGNILNIKMLTQAPLSYTTFGQNVPDDIVVTDAQYIAKQLLGGND